MTGLSLSPTEATHSHYNGTTEQTLFTMSSVNNNVVKGVYIDTTNLTVNTTFRVKYKIDGTNYRTLQTTYWTTSMDDGVFIEGDLPINHDFAVTAQSSSAEGASRNVPYGYWTEGVGAGAETFTYTVTDSVSGDPIQSCQIGRASCRER